jgi:branched-chain amino acid aminotransferase
MATLLNERVAYLNGEYVPESRTFVHFRDRGFVFGDAVFDTARTFGGRIYRLEAHVERLFRSLRYLRIDPGLGREELGAITEEVVERNRHLLGPGEDYWVSQRVSRGSNLPGAPGARTRPTVIVECTPLPLAQRAALFRDGVAVVIPSVRRTPPESLCPNAKMQNYLNLIVAGFEHEPDGRTWPILLDTRGFLSEGSGSNLFLVRDGEVLTPRAEYVLPGVSRAVVMDLCTRLGLPCREGDLSLYDAAIAEEGFLTSTSLCVCPVESINGQPLAEPALPGPVTSRIMAAFSEEVGFDFAGQYLGRLEGG